MRKGKDSEITKKRRKNVQRNIHLRRHHLRLLHHLAEAGRLRGRLIPPGRRRPALGLLRPATEQARRGTALLPAAPSRRRGGGTRAVARRRLAAWDDFRLVVIRPVVEADSKLEPPASPPAWPPAASVLSSMAAAPKSGSSKSCSARSGRNRRSAPAVPAAGRRRGLFQDVPTGQSRPRKTW